MGWLARLFGLGQSPLHASQGSIVVGGNVGGSTLSIGLSEEGVVKAAHKRELENKIAETWATIHQLERRLKPPRADRNEPLNELESQSREIASKINRGFDRQDWAHAQTSLGISLSLLGSLADGNEARTIHLTEAVAAFRLALTVFTPKNGERWAFACKCLGSALTQRALGGMKKVSGHMVVEDETDFVALEEAVGALREAVAFWTEEGEDELRHETLSTLGLALELMCHGDLGDDCLEQAVEVYQEALRSDDGDGSVTRHNLRRCLKALEARQHRSGSVR